MTRQQIIDRHNEGVARLNEFFGWDVAYATKRAKHTSPRWKRVRRKAAHEARRRNR